VRQKLEEQPGAEWELAASWDEEYERTLASLAMKRVEGEFKPTTWQAFWRTAVEGQAAAEVGEALGRSAGAVYVARSRVLARIKEVVRQLQESEG
jgi:RNA polymerase sigma-70 factor (ECF subfamily)